MNHSLKSVVIEGHKINLFKELRELLNYRELLFSLTVREIKARYKQTLMGSLWAIIPPLILMTVFTVIFSVFIKIDTKNIPYPVFSYTALVPWFFFSRTLEHGTRGFISNSGLITKIYFPREVIPFSLIVANCFDFLIAFGILLLLMLYFQVAFSWYMLWCIPLILLQLLLISNIVLVTSAMNVAFRDVSLLLPLILQVWFYLTPIIYPIEQVPKEYIIYYMLNPMVTIIQGYRNALLYHQSPDLFYFFSLLSALAVLCFLSYWYFKKSERYFADVI